MLRAHVWAERFEAIIRWGLFLLLPLPLRISSSMLFPFITGRNFGFRIIIEIFTVLWVGLLAVSENHRPRLTWLTRVVIVFLFVVALADILGVNPIRSFWSNYERMEGLISIMHMVLFFFIATSVLRRFRHWRLYLYGSALISLIVAFIGLLQKFGVVQSYQGGVRVDATIGNPAYLASYLLFNIFFLLFLMWREERIWLRWVSAAVILFELCVVYFTATRGAILALIPVLFVLSLFFISYFRKSHSPKEKIVRWIAAVFVIASVALGALFFIGRNIPSVKSDPVLGRFVSISPSEATTRSRFLIWHMALQGVAERPILGWGQENFYMVFNKYFDPRLWSAEPWFDRSHNVFLDWTIHAGILGLISYLLMLFFSIKNIGTAHRRGILSRYEALMFWGMFAVYFIQNLFVFDNFQSYFFLFLSLGFSDFLARGEEPAKEKAPSTMVSPARLWAPVGIAAILMSFVIYIADVKPIMAAEGIITALSAASTGATIPAVEADFHQVLDLHTFGSGEAVEQLGSMSRSAISAQGRGSPDDIQHFISFAVDELKKLAASSAPDAKYDLFLGVLYNNAAQLKPSEYPPAAIQVLNEALRLSPRKQQIYLELTNSYLMMRNFPAAMDTIKKAALLDPTFPTGQIDVAIVSAIVGDKNSAKEGLARYQALVPEPSDQDRQRILRVYTQMNDLPAARAYIESLIAKNPAHAVLYEEYAALLAALGESDKAKATAAKAVELDPSLKGQADQFLKQLR